MKLPVHLCLQPTDFSTLFDPQAFCAAVTPFLPFPSVLATARSHSQKELPTKVIRKEKRSLSQQAWEYLRGLVVAPNSFQSTRTTLKQYEYIIAVYLCFLLLLRGDLLSLVYVVLLFCYGLVTPVCVSASFTSILLILSIVSTLLRYLVQTPLVCQTSRPSSGAWRLLLHVGSPRWPDA